MTIAGFQKLFDAIETRGDVHALALNFVDTVADLSAGDMAIQFNDIQMMASALSNLLKEWNL